MIRWFLSLVMIFLALLSGGALSVWTLANHPAERLNVDVREHDSVVWQDQEDGPSSPKQSATKPAKSTDKPILRTGRISDDDVSESSGLSLASKNGYYWTLNDSGCPPILFRLTERGEVVQKVKLDAENRDWEALSRIEVDKKVWLIVADVGDNGQKRGKYQLYFRVVKNIVGRAGILAGVDRHTDMTG